MKKTFQLAGAVAAVAALALTACAPGESTNEPAAQNTADRNLTYLYFTDGPDEQVTRDLIAEFEKKHNAKVTLEVIPYSNLEQTLQARLAGNNAPDVARLSNLGPFKADLMDLAKYKKGDIDGKFLDGVKGSMYDGDKIIAVASDLTMNGPLVNVDMFEKAGVPLPTKDNPWKSWDDMVAAGQKVKEANGTEYALAMDVSGHRLSTMMSQYGTTLFSEDGKSVNWDVAKGTAAMTKFNELNQSGAMPKDLFLQSGAKYKAANEIFLAQQTPIYISGNWQVAALTKNAQFKWAAVPNACQERCGGFPGGKFMAGFNQSKNHELAAEFITFMNSKEAQTKYAVDANFLPTRKDLVESGVAYTNRKEDMTTFLEELRVTPNDTYGSAYSPAFAAAAKSIQTELAVVLAGQKSPEDASKAVRKAAEDNLAAAK